MSQNDERTLPHSLDAERALLGAVFLHNDFMFDVAEIVTDADFYEQGHGELFRLMRDMIETGRAVSPITLLSDMAQDRDIGGVRASEYLRQLYDEGVPGGVDQVKEVARGIADNALARRLIGAGQQMIRDVYDRPPSMGAAYLRDKYDTGFAALFPALKDFGIRHISEYGESVLNRTQEAFRTDLNVGLGLGLVSVQDLTGPLLPGRVVALAGASGSGKSAMVQQWLETICAPAPVDRQKIGLWIQAEMEGEEVASRGMSALTAISGERIERAMIDEAEFTKLIAANDEMKKAAIYVDASTLPTVAKIRARALRMKRSRGLHVIAIDHLLYLGKPAGGERMSDVEAIGPNMRELKALAKDLGVPVVILMPLKSSANEADIRRPRMADLTHPAAIDQNSDVILFVHRPEYILGRNEPDKADKAYADWQLKMEQWKNKAEAIMTKRRGGKGFGIRSLWFDDSRVRFSDNEPRGRMFKDDGRLPLGGGLMDLPNT